jgi:hypothetical protein
MIQPDDRSSDLSVDRSDLLTWVDTDRELLECRRIAWMVLSLTLRV